MTSCSMSQQSVPSITPQPTVGRCNKQDNLKTRIKFSIDEILKPSFGRCQTGIIKVEKECSHIDNDEEGDDEEDEQDISLYDDLCRNGADIDLDDNNMSHSVIHNRLIKQPMDISYLFSSHLANFQKQNVFYLPYGFHIGSQLHFLNPFGHYLPGLYSRFCRNYENGELDLGQKVDGCRFEENIYLDNTAMPSARTYKGDTELSIQNVSQNANSTKVKQFNKSDFKLRKTTDLNDSLSKCRDIVFPSEFKTSKCSNYFPDDKLYKNPITFDGGSSNTQYNIRIEDNANTNHTVTANTKTCTSQGPKATENKALPAWVFCTRYSDRPSSGPRYRKARQRTKSESDKRPRTAFSSQQLQCLRFEFESSPYLCEKRRKQLSATLNLSESQVKIWFQNKRAKLKKRSGRKNSLALRLIEEGLYNHSTIVADDCNGQSTTTVPL